MISIGKSLHTGTVNSGLAQNAAFDRIENCYNRIQPNGTHPIAGGPISGYIWNVNQPGCDSALSTIDRENSHDRPSWDNSLNTSAFSNNQSEYASDRDELQYQDDSSYYRHYDTQTGHRLGRNVTGGHEGHFAQSPVDPDNDNFYIMQKKNSRTLSTQGRPFRLTSSWTGSADQVQQQTYLRELLKKQVKDVVHKRYLQVMQERSHQDDYDSANY
jgi:hypothetical protein